MPPTHPAQRTDRLARVAGHMISARAAGPEAAPAIAAGGAAPPVPLELLAGLKDFDSPTILWAHSRIPTRPYMLVGPSTRWGGMRGSTKSGERKCELEIPGT